MYLNYGCEGYVTTATILRTLLLLYFRMCQQGCVTTHYVANDAEIQKMKIPQNDSVAARFFFSKTLVQLNDIRGNPAPAA